MMQTYFQALGPLSKLPDWKIAHLLAGITVDGANWNNMTFDEKDALRAEMVSRGAGPVEDRETVEETQPTPDVAGDDVDTDPPLDETPGPIFTVNSDMARDLIAEADTVDALDRLEASERGSDRHEGGRKGVLEAIARRRAEITLESDS